MYYVHTSAFYYLYAYGENNETVHSGKCKTHTDNKKIL